MGGLLEFGASATSPRFFIACASTFTRINRYFYSGIQPGLLANTTKVVNPQGRYECYIHRRPNKADPCRLRSFPSFHRSP